MVGTATKKGQSIPYSAAGGIFTSMNSTMAATQVPRVSWWKRKFPLAFHVADAARNTLPRRHVSVQESLERDYLWHNWKELYPAQIATALVMVVYRVVALALDSGVNFFYGCLSFLQILNSCVIIITTLYAAKCPRTGVPSWRLYIESGIVYYHWGISCTIGTCLSWIAAIDPATRGDFTAVYPPLLVTAAASVAVVMLGGLPVTPHVFGCLQYCIAAAAFCCIFSQTASVDLSCYRVLRVLLLMMAAAGLTLMFSVTTARVRRRMFAARGSLRERYRQLRRSVRREERTQEQLVQLRHTEAAAVAAQQAQSMVISFLNHQIRNPLHRLVNVRHELGTLLAGVPHANEELRSMDEALDSLHLVCEAAITQYDALERERRPVFRIHRTFQVISALRRALSALRGVNWGAAPSLDEDVPETVRTDLTMLCDVFVSVARWLLRRRAIRNAETYLHASSITAPRVAEDRLRSPQSIVVSQGWLDVCLSATHNAKQGSGRRAESQEPQASASAGSSETGERTQPEHENGAWQWFLHVQMTMVGIALGTHDVAHLFAPFTLGDHRGAVDADLDLAVAHSLAAMCHARIGLYASAPGRGNTSVVFFADIPLHLPLRVAPATMAGWRLPAEDEPYIAYTSAVDDDAYAAAPDEPRSSANRPLHAFAAGSQSSANISATHERFRPMHHPRHRPRSRDSRARSSHRSRTSTGSSRHESYTQSEPADSTHAKVESAQSIPSSDSRAIGARASRDRTPTPPIDAGNGELPQLAYPISHSESGPIAAGPESRAIQVHRRARILVVDDEAVNRRLHERMLARLGVEAVCVSDGDEVLPAIAEANALGIEYDAILLDVIMKKEHGDAVCVKLRDMGFTAPIIAATGNDTPADRERYEQLGFSATLSKPFRGADLANVLYRCGVVTATRNEPEAPRREGSR